MANQFVFNPPPGWPAPPSDWKPWPGWQPDPSWPPAPNNWVFWLPVRETFSEESELPFDNVDEDILDSFEETQRISYAVVDFETTGLNIYHNDRIVEIAVVLLDEDLNITNSYVTVVNPLRSISNEVSDIHGIDSKLASHAPSFKDVLPGLLHMISGRKLVAHNAPYDSGMFDQDLEKAGLPLETEQYFLDTLYAFKNVIEHDAGSNRLTDLAANFEVEHDNAHTALSDAMATAELLKVALAENLAFTDLFNNPETAFLTFPSSPGSLSPEEKDRWVSREMLAKVIADEKPPALYTVDFINKLPETADVSHEQMQSYITILHESFNDQSISVRETAAMETFLVAEGFSAHLVYALHAEYVKLLTILLESGGLTFEEQQLLEHTQGVMFSTSTLIKELVGELQVLSFETSFTLGSALKIEIGERITITGEPSQYAQIAWEEYLQGLGYEVANIAKSKTKILFVSDLSSLSGKAQKAREWGIPMATEEQMIERFGHPKSFGLRSKWQ